MLFFDLETAPATAFLWQADTQYIPMEMLITNTFLLNWGAKWADGKNVLTDLITPEEVAARDDRRICESIADLIRRADAVVAHNGDRFDVPVLNSRLLYHQSEPLGPVRCIDTLKLAKQSFRLTYNKLDYLADYLGVGRKLKTDMDLWKQCMAGDLQALKRMQRYNRQDVLLLEAVYQKMIPYVKRLPRLVDALREGERVCPFCGSEALIGRGYQVYAATTFGNLQCKSCGRYSRYRTAERLKKVGLVPL